MRTVQACLISIALFILSFDLSHASDSFAWETFNETLSTSGNESQLVTGSDGIPTALWVECADSSCSQRSLFSSRYASNRWSSPTIIATNESISLPRLAPSINGELLAVWLEQGLTIKSSWWKSGTWSSAATVAINISANQMESTVDNEGVATVIWSLGHIETSRGQGESWTVSQTLCKPDSTESGYGWCGDPQLAVDSVNVVTAAWVARKGSYPGLNVPRSSRFDNGEWGEPEDISRESTSFYMLLRIASIKPGEVTASWNIDNEAQSSHYFDSIWHPAISLGPSVSNSYSGVGKSNLLNIGKDTVISVWGGGGGACHPICNPDPFWTSTLFDGVWSTPNLAKMEVVDIATDGMGHAMLLGRDSTKTFDEQGWGQAVKLTGVPNTNYPEPIYTNPVNLTMSTDGSATMLLNGTLGLMGKNGLPNPFTVTIEKKGLGNVVSQPQGLDCGVACLGYFHSGTVMELTPIAPPESGYGFSNWEGDCSGINTCRLSVDDNKIVTAKFTKLPKYRISAVKPSAGFIHGFPLKTDMTGTKEINCPNDCSKKYYKGQAIAFEAHAKDNYYLNGWRGCAVQSDNTCNVVLDRQNMHVKAIFKKKPKYLLTLRKNTHGSVDTNLPEGNCAAYKTKCVYKVTEGSEVLLSMRPKPGKTYIGWAGDCAGTNPECRLIMNQDKFVEAIFD